MVESVTMSPVMKSFVAGSFSGTCSTILFQPLDLVKTRLQNPISFGRERVGMLAIFGKVVRNERIFGLWKGMTPSMFRCVPGVGIYFSSLHILKSQFFEGNPTPLQALLLGASARTLTASIMIPITVVKTRYESGLYNYKSVGDAVKSIYTKEGARGLTSGLLPTLLRDAPFSGLYLMFYTQSKQIIPEELLDSPLAPPIHFSCGVVAGLLASAVTQPFDVIKTKMQLYPHRFQNFIDVALYIYKRYSVQGYFKGLMPRMVRRTLMAAMAWTVYEQVMLSFALK